LKSLYAAIFASMLLSGLIPKISFGAETGAELHLESEADYLTEIDTVISATRIQQPLTEWRPAPKSEMCRLCKVVLQAVSITFPQTSASVAFSYTI